MADCGLPAKTVGWRVDVVAGVHRPAGHFGVGLAVFQLAEGKLSAVTAQALGETYAKRRPAEDVLAPGPRLALGVRREIDMEDGRAIHLARWSPASVVYIWTRSGCEGPGRRRRTRYERRAGIEPRPRWRGPQAVSRSTAPRPRRRLVSLAGEGCGRGAATVRAGRDR